jgi:isopentenyl-diphosphate Delta-isomerase
MKDAALGRLPRRKQEHLEICLAGDVSSGIASGAERYRLVHRALPELSLDQVDLGTTLLGKRLNAPLLISSMTGGTQRAGDLNRILAEAAQRLGIAMGLGSLRAAIEDSSLLPTYQVRDVAPDILLFANLGAVQLNYGISPEDCQRSVDSVGADALILHLNPLQEALQPEGEVDFRGLHAKIAHLCQRLTVPVVVKEVGHGISGQVATMLRDAGVAAIDVAGAGGTSWSAVEALRNPNVAAVADAFRAWGIPTFEALVQVRAAVPDLSIIASGGIANGADAAKALALGASAVGCARPWLRAVAAGPDVLDSALDTMIRQLRIALFCCGAPSLPALGNHCIEVRDSS